VAVDLTATAYLTMGDAAQLEFDPSADSFSVCHWVKVGDLVGFASVLSKMLNSMPYNGWESAVFTDEKPWFYVVQTWSTKAYRAKGLTALTQNVWQHVCWVWTPAGATLYIDGAFIELNVDTDTAMDASGHLTEVGCVGRRNAVTGATVGHAADLRVYGRALSAQEVLTIATLKGSDQVVNGLLFRMIGEELSPGSAVGGVDCGPNRLTVSNGGSPLYVAGPLRKVA
jgi:hypothetical protein